MQLNFANANINFLGQRRIAMVISGLLLLASVLFLIFRGLNFGIDFTGGTLVEVGYPEPVALEEVRDQLEEGGYGRATVQYFGTSRDVLIRLAPREGQNTADLSEGVLRVLRSGGPEGVELRRVEFVGPQVGEELREKGGLAMIYALFGILIYVALRFEWRFSLGSVAALVHDVVITLGIFSALWLEFDLAVLAAILAVIGYSLNDTIVVYDRIRENFRKLRKDAAETVMNKSVNQVLARTIVTSATTLLVLLCLYFLGGAVIQNFALALIIGVIVGTYSSIYVAAAAALMLGVDRKVLLPVKKEGEEFDSLP
ncbi:protein translocase subunit secF [Ectothiorhodosinus mongolicus]|uniref:Protein-export membrane protein SecF n=1 Tax=Ectothiorhodosinus mongolicus TaxID=233100 RepID=A0A1R3W6K5_9GAMM|nr:protein translocase subunit SecF [Ectothiorhodosinus mongolicus]ULX57650.1 protein translocase subunit SecF [Ectothiorhodosinus mongolicus]SIT73296.1 protein translocase subunit secF [Ectothiorhodosinus mongolicus]